MGTNTPTASNPIRNSPPSIPSTVKQRKKLQMSRGKTIRASIEYVVCLPTLVSFYLFGSQSWTKRWAYQPHGQANSGRLIFPQDTSVTFGQNSTSLINP